MSQKALQGKRGRENWENDGSKEELISSASKEKSSIGRGLHYRNESARGEGKRVWRND